MSDASAFRQEVERDIDDVFLNPGEFGELHEVAGKEITVVKASGESIELAGGYAIGLAKNQIMIFAKTEDLPPSQESGSMLNMDGSEYTVDDWGDDAGMSKITLSARRMY